MLTIISDIPSRKAFLNGEGTLEIGYPWLTFGAIIALEGLVNKSMKVLEFGSGGSTLFWANNCKIVKSFETNKDWYKAVETKVKPYNNVELIHANETQILEALKKEPENFYDIVLIDPHPKDANRLLLANIAKSKVKSGGNFIIDNYLKFGMEKFSFPNNWEIYTFDDFRYSGRGTKICKVR